MTNLEPQGYLAAPAYGNGRGVLVLHPWWGLNDTIRMVCTRLSEAGFIAFAADLYHGKIATTIEEAESLMKALDHQIAKTQIAEAVEFLSGRAGQDDQRIGVIGFSLGAAYALDLSAEDPDHICAVAVFYGTSAGDYSTSRADYLGHFAEDDEFEPASEVNSLEASLRAAGRPVTFYRYSGTRHWFFEPNRIESYNQTAATLAWKRTLTFLRNTLPVDSN
jgi:carboxymethylenebutenolidase